jgi:hypothetical protein
MDTTNKEYTVADEKKIDINNLADICDVEVDPSLPQKEKIKSYLRQIKNPYLYRCDDIVVRASFAKNGASLGDRLKQYLLSGQGLAL